jgi:hypothetical protein
VAQAMAGVRGRAGGGVSRRWSIRGRSPREFAYREFVGVEGEFPSGGWPRSACEVRDLDTACTRRETRTP